MVYHGGPEDDDRLADDAFGDDLDADPEDDDLDPLESDEPEDDPAAPESKRESRRKRLERILPEVLKRAIERGLETGIGTLTNSSEALRGVVGKVELPKEVAGYVLSQVDDTKNVMVRVVAREVREFLEAADLAKELQRALTSLSFEIRTEIRFIPNDSGGVTPDVKARVGSAPPRRPAARRRRGLTRPSAERSGAGFDDGSDDADDDRDDDR